MANKRLKNPIFLFYILVCYVILQFSWWLYLIFSLYKQTYNDPVELSHKSWMLIGEGTVFFIILFGGAMMIRRAFRREKELNEIQENFLQSVSHELKTPIASVGLYLQTLKKHELDTGKRQDIYDRSLVEIDRLNMLVSDILTARNIDSDNYFFDKVKFNLGEHISETIDRLKDSILKGHQLEFNIQNLECVLDKAAFDRIFYNLLENAIKYSPADSTISFKLESYQSGIKFSLSDEGKGIKNDQKKLVFDKFYRTESETTRKSKGTGLGLYIVKFLVEGQGGTIKLLDNQPNGLTIEILFSNE